MKVVFPVTIILLFALANQGVAQLRWGGPLQCPPCAYMPPEYAKGCKYGHDTSPFSGFGSNTNPKSVYELCGCGRRIIPCAPPPEKWYIRGPPPSEAVRLPIQDALYEQHKGFRGADIVSLHDSRRLQGADVVGLHYSDINIPIEYSRAMAEKDIKFGSVVTGIPESKFDKFIKGMLYIYRSHIIRVAFDEDLGMHVGLGAATVRGCNDKIQIVVVAKRSSNLEKLKVALEKALKSKMKPSKPCSRRLRGADVL